jgi:hypothetical protein
MSSTFHSAAVGRDNGMQSHLFFGAVYPFFLAAEGVSRILARYTTPQEGAEKDRRPLFAQARVNASIATSYALMARTMLHSSGRENRRERLS